MTTLLTQHVGDAPDSLPGSTTLRFDAEDSPAVLLHDLGDAIEVLYVRFMLSASQADGGTCVIAGGIGDDGRSTWQLTLNADNQSLTLNVAGTELSVGLTTAIAWHTVEVGLDASADNVTLRLNGIERGSASAPTIATRYAWLGAAFVDVGLAGVIDFDHWVLATNPIGVPLSTPTHDHAGDPRRWLVIYNRDDDDSAAWAAAYRQRRGLAYANLCGLSLPTDETITDPQYQNLRQQIADYLSDNAMTGQVVGLLLGYGVPGYADLTLQGPTPLTSYLHNDASHGNLAVNPLYQATITTRLLASDYGSYRLTGRIDAPDLPTALSLIDRADNLLQQPLAHDQGADLLIDINPDDPSVGPVYASQVSDWALSQLRDRLRLPTVIFDSTPPTSASGEAVVWGWRDAAPSSSFFATPAGRRALCLQFYSAAQYATTLRDASATDWLNTALRAGYAAAALPSRPFSLSTLPLPATFFEAMRQGWTLAEAWLVSQPFIRGGLQLVGDPLLTLHLPKEGVDVFGPVARLDQIDFDQPLAVLHAGQSQLQLALEDAPPTGGYARYLVRRYDAMGRADFACASDYVALEQSHVIRPAMPAWPSFDSWRVQVVADRLVLTAVWPAPLRNLAIDRVQLQSQAEEESIAMIDAIDPVVGQCRAVFSVDRPTITTRYRFRVVQGPATFDSPWSAWVAPASSTTASLTLLENYP